MIFTDEQTEIAIDIIHMAEKAAKEKIPFPDPVDVLKWEKEAAAGNKESYKQAMCAKLHMVYPVLPVGSGSPDRAKLWQSIVDGRYEGILVVNSLDYQKAYEEYETPPRLGSYFERWLSTAIRNELARAIVDGWKP